MCVRCDTTGYKVVIGKQLQCRNTGGETLDTDSDQQRLEKPEGAFYTSSREPAGGH